MKHNIQIIDRPDSEITQKITTSHQNVVGETIKKSSFSNFEDDSQTLWTFGAIKNAAIINKGQAKPSIQERVRLSATRARERYITAKKQVSAMIAKEGDAK
jgi:hypothetical protein